MSEQKESTQELKTATLSAFTQAMDLVQTNKAVGENVNGYPYITFIDSKNEATNIYFSKEASKDVVAGTPINAELLAQYRIGYTTNAEGEPRIKLVGIGGRLNLADMLG